MTYVRRETRVTSRSRNSSWMRAPALIRGTRWNPSAPALVYSQILQRRKIKNNSEQFMEDHKKSGENQGKTPTVDPASEGAKKNGPSENRTRDPCMILHWSSFLAMPGPGSRISTKLYRLS
ncbi:hypothetical protein BV25DRAFT_663961 [Artomyces pyxidatus]|uniref:Uncharacterized protein n=1 Tax=Artomyces pyxidatus TaxID=48021 RepID=A0ACB8T0H4_9AGAM|nr:hypothetical protein BV25DRAFT_663961 [Artomyces pyxidatus]